MQEKNIQFSQLKAIFPVMKFQKVHDLVFGNGTCETQFSGKATAGVNSYKIHYRHKYLGEHNDGTVRSTPNEQIVNKY